MEINKKQIEITIIGASEGYYLTRKERKDNEQIVLGKEIILGKHDSPDNYTEISIEEGERIQARFNAEQQAETQLEHNDL